MTELLPAAQRYDLRRITVDDVLDRVETSLQLQLLSEGSVRKRRSIGFRSDRNTWVQIKCRGLEKLDGQGWGFEAAQVLNGVPVPDWYAGVSWLDSTRRVMWRAEETGLIDQAPIGRSSSATLLPDEWWAAFDAAMGALAEQRTTRLATPDCVPITVDRIESTIRRVFPHVARPIVDEWATAHADLNWANMTEPGLWILDWEDWGRAPRGLDAANLWFGSLTVPEISGRVRQHRRRDLESLTGHTMMLFKCAELLSWSDDTEPLNVPAKREAGRLILQLERRLKH